MRGGRRSQWEIEEERANVFGEWTQRDITATDRGSLVGGRDRDGDGYMPGGESDNLKY
jgi:hypothetical protein